MTATVRSADAPFGSQMNWKSINWRLVRDAVRRLHVRIAKAVKEEKFRKARPLQWILTHSYYAKLWAIKRVTSNKGKRTPDVDGIVWTTPGQKLDAVKLLKRRGYRPLPLRRIYIPKKNKNKKRPLSIPTMNDRACQALYKLALEPVAETLADPNSHGFRAWRGCSDAIGQCFIFYPNLFRPGFLRFLYHRGFGQNARMRINDLEIRLDRFLGGQSLVGYIYDGETAGLLKEGFLIVT
jgi:RNA-directed DNA polymerase